MAINSEPRWRPQDNSLGLTTGYRDFGSDYSPLGGTSDWMKSWKAPTFAAPSASGGVANTKWNGPYAPIEIPKKLELSKAWTDAMADLTESHAANKSTFDAWMGETNKANASIADQLAKVTGASNRLYNGDIANELAAGRTTFGTNSANSILKRAEGAAGLRAGARSEGMGLVDKYESDIGAKTTEGLDAMLARIAGLETGLAGSRRAYHDAAEREAALSRNATTATLLARGMVPGTSYNARLGLREANRLGADLALQDANLSREDLAKIAGLRLGVDEAGLGMRRADLGNVYNQRAPIIASDYAGRLADLMAQTGAEQDLQNTLFNAGRGDTTWLAGAQMANAGVVPGLTRAALSDRLLPITARNAVDSSYQDRLASLTNLFDRVNYTGLETPDGYRRPVYQSRAPSAPDGGGNDGIPPWVYDLLGGMNGNDAPERSITPRNTLRPIEGYDYKTESFLNPAAWGDYSARNPTQQSAFERAQAYYE